ncbi:245a40e3-53f0-4b2a-a0fd-cd281756bd9b [Sclerotinia trifoliorum]|uniref:245a40e3-53f0-4b2a-a0fd-cd281756bd9b n=1 Tax=Sclerotinia trifoliorum TaxID=28548 RepID=A0A8H2W2J4_9HELO|nr:245a40e3-53f0-4b2a-a0fd-cd281756bd9b [Sclerotinia trifoliorum]
MTISQTQRPSLQTNISPPASSHKSPPASSHKSQVRERVWEELRYVAIPDSRFGHDYSSFICDFVGSNDACRQLISLPCYSSAETIFIAPDNCLQELRCQALKDGKMVVCTTYGIQRGFFILNPKEIPEQKWEVASYLDGMERYGRPVTLTEIRGEGIRISLMVTGTGAINYKGLRFGKGHGFFDLEWGMLYSVGAVNKDTHTAALVHECQVLDEEFKGEQWDTGCQFVVTNKRVITVSGAAKPGYGIIWDKLQKGMMDDIESLRELQNIMSPPELKSPQEHTMDFQEEARLYMDYASFDF